MSTIKELLDRSMLRIGLPTIDQYFGGDDQSGKMVAELANEALEVFTQKKLSKLQKEHSFAMTTAETYTLPSDFRYIVPDTIQIQDQERYIDFPQNSRDWFYFKSKTSASQFNFRMRIADGSLQVDNPQSGETVIFEYVTDLLVTATGGSSPTKARFTVDTDEFLLDDGLLIRYVSWKFKQRKGVQGWQVDERDFKQYESYHYGQEGGSETLDFCLRDYPEHPYHETWVNND